MFREDDVREDSRRDVRDKSAGRDDTFTRHLDLPDGRSREQIGGYQLRGSEGRALATVGSFRVVPRHDLERLNGAMSRDVERLRDLGLLETTPYMVGTRRTTIVTLTHEGHALLESHRGDCHDGERQSFYAGVARPREMAHDSRLFAAYVEARDRLAADGLRVRRVVLEQQLKTEYQRFLQEPNRGQRHSRGVPRRDRERIEKWAAEHNLPVIRDSVRFPDLRLEYDRADGTRGNEDVEIVTGNYRGAHASGTAAAGFKCHRYSSARVGGARSSTRGGRSRDPRLAEEMWR